MEGRLVNELRISKATEEKLKEMPEYVSEWYDKLATSKTASTCSDYIAKVHKFLEYVNPDIKMIELSDLNSRVAVKYFNSLKYKETKKGKVETSCSYRNTNWYCLNSFFDFLYKSHYIKENYWNNIDKVPNTDGDHIDEKRVRLTIDDFRNILSSTDLEKDRVAAARDKSILSLLMNTGMRETELRNINIEDIDFEEKKLSVIGKRNKKHEYVLNDKCIAIIKNWIHYREKYNAKATGEDTNALFLSNRGKRIATRTLDELVQKHTFNGIGKALMPHKLRAGFITIMYDEFHDIEKVRRIAGHSNADTTKRYIVTDNKERADAAKLLQSLL